MQNTILIVDDDADARLLVTEIAHIAGFDAVSADNFPDAQRVISKGTAAVLLDLVMPDQLCIRIAAYMAEESCTTPAILMSGAADSEIQRMRHMLNALGLNIVSTLRKPFWVDELLEAMATALPHAPTSIGIAETEGETDSN